MINKSFEAYKIKREIKRSGIDYEFKRLGRNEFGEPNDNETSIGTLKGLYHEESSAIKITTGDTTQIRTKKIPKILCLYEDIAFLVLRPGDLLNINDKIFKVTGIVNVQEWSIVADISLEVVDNGIQA